MEAMKSRQLPSSMAKLLPDWTNLKTELTKENLPKRVFKCCLATSITIIIALIPNIRDVYGRACYLAVMTSVFVFGHPGRRLGAMIEALAMAAFGASIGIAWSTLGTFLSSFCHQSNPVAEQSIKAIFVMIAAFTHAYIRSSTPRLFLLVLLLIIPVLIGMTAPSTGVVNAAFVKQFFYPILTAVAVMLLVSMLVFPELGSTDIGKATIEVLQLAKTTQRAAADLFVTYAKSGNTGESMQKLQALTTAKGQLAKKLADCRNVYKECTFEIAISVLAPADLKPITGKGLKGLVGRTMNLVGACESAYSFLGIEEAGNSDGDDSNIIDLDKFRGKRDTEIGDVELLQSLLKRVQAPLMRIEADITRALDITSACVAIAYDLPDSIKKRDSTGKQPSGILIEELDIHVQDLTRAIGDFGRSSAEALEGAAAIHESEHGTGEDMDIMPREEVFLVCAFVLGVRGAAAYTLDILKHSRELLVRREARHRIRRLHFPRVKLKKWLFTNNDSGPEVRASTHKSDMEENDRIDREKSKVTKIPRKQEKVKSLLTTILLAWLEFRKILGHTLAWIQNSDSFLYATKFTFGVMLLSWPAFVASWASWYYTARGVWAPIIFILVFESAVGSTIAIFMQRSAGTIIGSLWGWAAYEAGGGNEIVMAAMLMIGMIPNFYLQLGFGLKYQKVGMICTISSSVVALSTHLQTVPGTSMENFYKRVLTMFIGGSSATFVQLILFPVKAREELRTSICCALTHINRMESFIALGVDQSRNVHSSPLLYKRFEKIQVKANAALDRANAFIPATRNEPRIKGSFDNQALIYGEIIYVLKQITERMENMLQLRKAYGSALLEQYNSVVFSYRRNVAAAITLSLWVVRETLATKYALPQFLPSARIAHQRMVVRIRQILFENELTTFSDRNNPSSSDRSRKIRDQRLKFLSWNASSAALEECIEYVEELIDLTKTLVGVNEFRAGIFHRPNYMELAEKIKIRASGVNDRPRDGTFTFDDSATVPATILTAENLGGELEEIPTALTRIQSRRMGQKLERRRTLTTGTFYEGMGS